jgi:hypothetical protein
MKACNDQIGLVRFQGDFQLVTRLRLGSGCDTFIVDNRIIVLLRGSLSNNGAEEAPVRNLQ